MDGKVFWSGAMTIPGHAKSLSTEQQNSGSNVTKERTSCAGSMVILAHDQMLVGSDYRQVQLQSDPSDTKHCVDACCNDTSCTSWAVATSTGSDRCRPNSACCWLKNGTVSTEKQHGTRESAAGYKPGYVPPAHFNCCAIGLLQWSTHTGACTGLQHDVTAHNAHSCALNCCKDQKCVVWQL